MQPAEWFMINRNRVGASKFYMQFPFRYAYFRWATITLLMCFAELGLIVAKYWKELDLFVALSLVLAVMSTLFLWGLALGTHRHVNLLLTTRQVEKLELGSILHTALSTSATITNQGLLFVSLIAMGYLAALGEILRTRQ
jgi:hypothetical protein